jgi:hypothetical protein
MPPLTAAPSSISRAAGAVSVFPFSSRDGCGFPRRQLAAGVIVGSIFYHPREQSLRFNTFENFPCNRAKQSWRMTSALQFRVGPHGQKQTMRGFTSGQIPFAKKAKHV